jgi:succinyl-CoA synthetase beta subunit
MVEEVRAFPLLRGARGRPPTDIAALTDVIVKVQRLALDCAAELSELDINPLVVRPRGGGAIALDALAVAR